MSQTKSIGFLSILCFALIRFLHLEYLDARRNVILNKWIFAYLFVCGIHRICNIHKNTFGKYKNDLIIAAICVDRQRYSLEISVDAIIKAQWAKRRYIVQSAEASSYSLDGVRELSSPIINSRPLYYEPTNTASFPYQFLARNLNRRIKVSDNLDYK